MGIIDQSMQQPPPAPAPGGDPAASSEHLTPESVMAKMQLDPQQKQQLQRIVVAGMKVMFSPKSHHLMQQQLQGPGPLAQKMGLGVAGLMGILMQESQGAIPKNLVIPAAMILCLHAADFMRQSGQQVTDQDIGSAIEVCVHALLKVSGVDPDKLTQQPGAAGAPADPTDPAAAVPPEPESPAEGAAPGEEME